MGKIICIKKAQTLFSSDVGYQDRLLIFASFFILGKIKKIFLRRYQNKYEGVGASTDIEVIFKSLKISGLDGLMGNTERQHLQQISEEGKENTKVDFSGTCVEFSKYSVPFQNAGQLPLLKICLVWKPCQSVILVKFLSLLPVMNIYLLPNGNHCSSERELTVLNSPF